MFFIVVFVVFEVLLFCAACSWLFVYKHESVGMFVVLFEHELSECLQIYIRHVKAYNINHKNNVFMVILTTYEQYELNKT